MSNEELAVRIRHGDRELLAALWEQVRRFIEARAGRLSALRWERCNACGVSADDLIQAGFFALCDAVEAFDPSSGFLLLAFLHFPLRKRWNALLCYRTRRQYRDPLNQAESMDEARGGDEDPLAFFLADERAGLPFEEAEHLEWLRQLRQTEEELLDDIPADLAHVARARYFEGLTLAQTAKRIGKSPERVRQMQNKAIRLLRHPRRAARLTPFRYDDIMAAGLSGTGLAAFRRDGSATERAVEHLNHAEE